MPKVTIEVDSHLYTAELSVGATLLEFLSKVECGLSADTLLCDGQRVMVPRLEMAFRHREARLTTEIPPHLMREVAALTPSGLLVSADR